MFDNLRIALHQKGISVKQYAEILGIGEKIDRKNRLYISRI